MSRVSVIIPCYNRGEYIGETIDSVLNQSFQDFELIAVDDGSTDNTREILESYGDRITLLEHPGRVNKGQSAAINVGLASATGEFVAILDSDDLWYPKKLAEQVAFLDENAKVGFLYGNGEAVDRDGAFLYSIYQDAHRERNETGALLLDCYIHLPSNSIVRKAVYEAAGYFDESLRAAQDHDMAIRLAENTSLAFVNKKWFKYRRHAESISHQNSDRRWRNGLVILESAVRRYPYPNAIVRKRRAVLYFRLAQCSFENRRYIMACMNAFKAGLLDPGRALGVIFRRERVSSPH